MGTNVTWSSRRRPGSRVRRTSQAQTAMTSMTSVAVPAESTIEFFRPSSTSPSVSTAP